MPFEKGNTIGNRFQPGESGNPNGLPKGTVNLSTMIRQMLDEDIQPEDPKGKPKKQIQALVEVALTKSKAGDNKWAEWLAKYGFGQKYEIEHSGEIVTGNNDPELARGFAEYLKEKK